MGGWWWRAAASSRLQRCKARIAAVERSHHTKQGTVQGPGGAEGPSPLCKVRHTCCRALPGSPSSIRADRNKLLKFSRSVAYSSRIRSFRRAPAAAITAVMTAMQFKRMKGSSRGALALSGHCRCMSGAARRQAQRHQRSSA